MIPAMNIPEPLLLLAIFLLWTVLIALLTKASFQAVKKKQKIPATLWIIFTLIIFGLTAEWGFFFLVMALCEFGLTFVCP